MPRSRRSRGLSPRPKAGRPLMVVLVRLAQFLPVFTALAGLMSSTASGQAPRPAARLDAYAAGALADSSERASSDRFDTGIAGGKNFTVIAPRGDRLAEK